MFVDLVVASAESVLRHETDLVSRLVVGRKRFENWLQLEIYKRILKCNTETRVDVERPYPVGKERCDFWCHESDGHESWVELKLCVTNYAQNYTDQSSPRPITDQINSVIADIEKVRRISAADSARHVLLIAYPMPVGEELPMAWMNHLTKVKQSGASLETAFAVTLERAGKSAMVFGYKIST